MVWEALSNMFQNSKSCFYNFFCIQPSNRRLANLLKQGFQQIRLWQRHHFFAMFEQNATAIAARDTDIRVLRLAWSVHLTTG